MPAKVHLIGVANEIKRGRFQMPELFNQTVNILLDRGEIISRIRNVIDIKYNTTIYSELT